MAMPVTMTGGADNVLSAIIHKWLSTQWEPLFGSVSPLLTKLLAQKSQSPVGWGEGHRYPLAVPASGPSTVTVANSASAYAALTFTDTDFGRVADFMPHELIRPVSVQQYFIDAAKGDAAKLNWVQGVLNANLKTIKETIKAGLWAAEETETSGGYAAFGTRPPIGSIRTYFNAGTAATKTDALTPAELTEQLGNRGVCSATGATLVSSVGNISRAQSGGGRWAVPVINTSQKVVLSAISNIYRTATDGDEYPDLGITTKDVFAKMESVGLLMGSAWPGFQKGAMAQFGWETIRYLNMEITYDDNCPGVVYLNGATTAYDDQFFAINTKHLFWWRDAKEPTVELVASDGRPLKRWVIRHLCQLESDNLGRVHARHVNLDPT
jgi:hypothetical protein